MAKEGAILSNSFIKGASIAAELAGLPAGAELAGIVYRRQDCLPYRARGHDNVGRTFWQHLDAPLAIISTS